MNGSALRDLINSSIIDDLKLLSQNPEKVLTSEFTDLRRAARNCVSLTNSSVLIDCNCCSGTGISSTIQSCYCHICWGTGYLNGPYRGFDGLILLNPKSKDIPGYSRIETE